METEGSLLAGLKWREEDNKIICSVDPNGTNGAGCWDAWLHEKAGQDVRDILKSYSFKKETNISNIIIIKGEKFSDRYFLKDVYAEARKHLLKKMEVEDAFVIAEKLTACEMKKMGLSYIVIMHEPIDTEDIFFNESCFLTIEGNCMGCRLELTSDRPEFLAYTSAYGFAFANPA